jgi:hypothetical protein
MILKIEPLKFNSVLVQISDVEILAKTFMRFQEYYESPKFKGTIFTIGQLKEWYSLTYGADTYHRDWIGFNFPSSVLDPFRKGLFDPLIQEEQALLDLFSYRHDLFYIIGANDQAVIRHELAHALYAYSNAYKASIDRICKKYCKALKPIYNYLSHKGYCKNVLNDEVQAYVTDNDDKFILSNLDQKIINEINITYNKFEKHCSKKDNN